MGVAADVCVRMEGVWHVSETASVDVHLGKKKKKVIKPTFRIPNQVRKLNSRLTHVMSPVFLVIKLPRLHPCFHLTFDYFFLQHFSLRTLTGPKRY